MGHKVKGTVQIKVWMLFMSYSYCPLPVGMWLVEKGLGRLTREMPCCKNTGKTSACLCSKENRSLVEDVNGKLPSLKGTMCAPLCGNLLFTAGLGSEQQLRFSRGQSKGSLHGSCLQQSQRMETLLHGVAA